MGTPGPGRKRHPNREGLSAEDQVLNQIAREVEKNISRPGPAVNPPRPQEPMKRLHFTSEDNPLSRGQHYKGRSGKQERLSRYYSDFLVIDPTRVIGSSSSTPLHLSARVSKPSDVLEL